MTTADPSVRARVGQGWALTACLVLVVLGYVTATLAAVINHIIVPSRFELSVFLPTWLIALAIPTTLLNLAAAALRRIGLTVLAMIVGILHTAALALLLVVVVAEISITASSLQINNLGVTLVGVAIATVGAALTLPRSGHRWPPTATAGLILAGLGAALPTMADLIAGPPLPMMGRPGLFALLALLVPASVALLGLAVAFRRRLLAALAAVLLVAVAIMPARNAYSWLGAVGKVDLAGVFILPATLTVLSLVLAIAATIGVIASLARTTDRGGHAGNAQQHQPQDHR